MPNDNTLLGFLSGGKYQTSKDIPTIPESIHGFLDSQISESEQPTSLLREEYLNIMSDKYGSVSGSKGVDNVEDIAKDFVFGGYSPNVGGLTRLPSTKSIRTILKSIFKQTPKEWSEIKGYGNTLGGYVDESNFGKTLRASLSVGKSKSGGGGDVTLAYRINNPTSKRMMQPMSEATFSYDPINKLLSDVELGADKGFEGMRMSSKVIGDIFKSLPKGAKVYPHPMNRNSLPLFLRYAEKNPDIVKIVQNFGKRQLSHQDALLPYNKGKMLLSKYKNVGLKRAQASERLIGDTQDSGLELIRFIRSHHPDVSSFDEASRLFQESLLKTPRGKMKIQYPDFLLQKIK